MFIKTCFTFTKIWIQPKCPSTDEWVKMRYIYTQWKFSHKKERNFAIRKTWVDLEDIKLSGMSDKDKYCISFIQKPQQNSKYNKKETDSHA